jgi:hypothetical protein
VLLDALRVRGGMLLPSISDACKCKCRWLGSFWETGFLERRRSGLELRVIWYHKVLVGMHVICSQPPAGINQLQLLIRQAHANTNNGRRIIDKCQFLQAGALP